MQFRFPDGGATRLLALNGRPLPIQGRPTLVEHWGDPGSGRLARPGAAPGAAVDMDVVEHLLRPGELVGADHFQRPPELAPNVTWLSDRAMVRTPAVRAQRPARFPPPFALPAEGGTFARPRGGGEPHGHARQQPFGSRQTAPAGARHRIGPPTRWGRRHHAAARPDTGMAMPDTTCPTPPGGAGPRTAQARPRRRGPGATRRAVAVFSSWPWSCCGWHSCSARTTSLGDLLMNLGTEVIGVVITVAVVESFLERRRLQNRGRQLAWDTLHAAETAVWVWQGGPREMETDEMLGILNAVNEDDPLPDFTRGPLPEPGDPQPPAAEQRAPGRGRPPGLHERAGAVGAPQRDPRWRAPMPPAEDRGHPGGGNVAELARALGQPTERHLASLIRYRDPSVESQERRHHGGRGTSPGPLATTDLDPDTMKAFYGPPRRPSAHHRPTPLRLRRARRPRRFVDALSVRLAGVRGRRRRHEVFGARSGDPGQRCRWRERRGRVGVGRLARSVR